MKEKIVIIALGGNALGDSIDEQKVAVKQVAVVIVDMIKDGFRVVLTHGNGPQVGMIDTAMTDLSQNYNNYNNTPLPFSVGMSQGYIGYSLQNAICSELKKRNIENSVASVVTQIVVDENDNAFETPNKPIGRFLTDKEANIEREQGNTVIEDSGRGYRKTVASPKPLKIIEMDIIKTLVEAGKIVITCGGGGIPVIENNDTLVGVPAVIDKDFASALLAKELNADYLVILTAVEKVAINFGKDNETWLSNLSLSQAQEYINEGQFAVGSMLPKIQAAMDFASSGKKRTSLITLLEKAKDGINGTTGTTITSF